MTGRDDRGRGPGRGIAGAVAMAMLLVLGAQGAIGAPSDKKPREEKKAAAQTGARKPADKGSAPAPAPQPQGAVTRSIGGVTVSIDPATGRLQPPTAEEAAALAAGLQVMLSRDTANLPMTELPDGTLMVSLDDTFQEVAMATVDRRGNIRLHCVNDAARAMAILDGTAPAGTEGVVYGSTKAAEKKSAAKSGRAAAEKE